MKDKLSGILNIMLVVLLAISAVILVVFYYGTSLYSAETEFVDQVKILGWRLDVFMNWSIILVLIGALAAFIFPVINMITNPATSKNALISLGVVSAVVLIAYSISDSDILEFPGFEKFFYEDNSMDAHKFSRYVGTGLWVMYIFGMLSVVSIVYAEVAKFFK